MGDGETFLVGILESLVRYHSDNIELLTSFRHPGEKQFQVGSLTGAVAFQKVTKAYKGFLRSVRNRS